MIKSRLSDFLLSRPGFWVRVAASLVLGVLVGVLLHFMLYRVSLPVQPFIYVAF